ncbi:MAG: MFS transporter [Rubrivivax sp.]|jgi:PPP family 3-phenylpropionic acid transporter|nr:MFS transporter [Rubrivivax sp.]
MTPAPAAPVGAFGAVLFCYFATIGAFNPYAPLWFKELGFSTLAIGFIASLQAWTRIAAPYAWGWMGDHGGERVRLIRAAALAALAAAVALMFTTGPTAVAVAVVVLFLANGGVMPLTEAALAGRLQTATGTDAARYGRVRMWGSIGFVVAVVAYGALLQAVGIEWFPQLTVAMSVLLLAAAWRLPRQADPVHTASAAPSVISVLRRPVVAWFFAAVFFHVLAHTSLYAFFSLYLDDLGYPKSAVGLLWAAAIVVEVVFFWLQGRFFDRFSAWRWLGWAAAAAVLRFVLTAAFGGQAAVLVAAQLLHALTFAAQHAACIMVVNRHFPGALRGRGQALYTVLGYGVSGVIGGAAGGWLGTAFGFASVFWAAAVAALLGGACVWRAARHDIR